MSTATGTHAANIQTVLGLGLGLTVVTAPGGSALPGTVMYQAGSLAGTATLTYTVTVKAANGLLRYPAPLAASALSVVPDPKPLNNLATATVTAS